MIRDLSEMLDRELFEYAVILLEGMAFGVVVIMLVAVIWWGMWMAKREG